MPLKAYYAGVSYSDTLVGKVVGEFEAQGFDDDTIIVLWADHGYQLGNITTGKNKLISRLHCNTCAVHDKDPWCDRQ